MEQTRGRRRERRYPKIRESAAASATAVTVRFNSASPLAAGGSCASAAMAGGSNSGSRRTDHFRQGGDPRRRRLVRLGVCHHWRSANICAAAGTLAWVTSLASSSLGFRRARPRLKSRNSSALASADGLRLVARVAGGRRRKRRQLLAEPLGQLAAPLGGGEPQAQRAAAVAKALVVRTQERNDLLGLDLAVWNLIQSHECRRDGSRRIARQAFSASPCVGQLDQCA